MTEAQVQAYVNATAALLELQLEPAQAQRVAEHLARSAALARLLDAYSMAPEDELAEIFRPAPFPGVADRSRKP
jgi:hypothetical protein